MLATADVPALYPLRSFSAGPRTSRGEAASAASEAAAAALPSLSAATDASAKASSSSLFSDDSVSRGAGPAAGFSARASTDPEINDGARLAAAAAR